MSLMRIFRLYMLVGGMHRQLKRMWQIIICRQLMKLKEKLWIYTRKISQK